MCSLLLEHMIKFWIALFIVARSKQRFVKRRKLGNSLKKNELQYIFCFSFAFGKYIKKFKWIDANENWTRSKAKTNRMHKDAIWAA